MIATFRFFDNATGSPLLNVTLPIEAKATLENRLELWAADDVRLESEFATADATRSYSWIIPMPVTSQVGEGSHVLAVLRLEGPGLTTRSFTHCPLPIPTGEGETNPCAEPRAASA